MTVTSLTQEEQDAIIYDAREGDLDYLQEIFSNIIPGSLLPTVKDENTLSTPVHMAAANGHFAVVEYLLSLVSHNEAVALANAKNDLGNTPLHWAAYNGHLDIVKLLVEKYGADVYAKNTSSHDALFEAEKNGKTEVENWMLSKFAPEETIKVEDVGEDTKITYTPGQESYEIDKQASEALEAAQKSRADVEAVEKKTEKLSI
ncbi:hypothetical protein JCM33374_g6519 [Metschnikowia sp. JCM 33374]|nr:hypothetical protein JCM33374_g6519 [Metschnikowia sp. JCM 33374]